MLKNKRLVAKGFTIVELLIVIVIIAILATITIVAYNGITDRANDSAMETTITSVAKKLSTDVIIDQSAKCNGPNDSAITACLNNSETINKLVTAPYMKDVSASFVYYVDWDGSVNIAGYSKSGNAFASYSGSLKEISAVEYRDLTTYRCGTTGVWSPSSKTWSLVNVGCG